MTRLRERGVALISVLLITALVTLIVSDMLARQRLTLVSSASQMRQLELWQMALSGEAWARERLRADLAEARDKARRPASDTPATDAQAEPHSVNLAQGWARGGTLDIGGGQVRVHLEDLSARFDLDSLRLAPDATLRARYQRLLALLEVPPHDPARLPAPPAAGGGLLGFADSSELARLDALDAAELRRLRPQVATLGGEALNLNTAPAIQLATLEGLDLASAQALVAARPREGWPSLQAFLEQPALHGRPIERLGLGLSSRHFRACLDVSLGDRRLRLASDFRTHDDGRVELLRRTLLAPEPTSED